MAVDFIADIVDGLSPLNVEFTSSEDEVPNPIAYYWHFGDGFTSIDKHPQHVYKMPGAYTVKLTVTFDDFSQLSETKINYIIVTDVENSDAFSIGITNKSFRYAIREEQGYGFSENTGDAWVFPEIGVGTINILDTYNQYRNLAYDIKTGHLYDLTTRNGSSTTGDVQIFKDQADVNGSGGTDIVPSVKFKEDRGELEHYFITNQDNHIYLRPQSEDNRGADGFTSAGFPSGMTVDVSMFADGEQTTESAKAEDILFPKNDVSFDKQITSHRLQTQVELSTSNVQLVGRTQYYKAADVPDGGDKRLMNESTYQSNIASGMTQWITRGSNLLLDRMTGTVVAGTVTAITGPDSQEESAMQITAGNNVALSNDSISNGRIQLWAKDSGDYSTYFDTINSVTLENVGVKGDWNLLKYEGAIPSDVSLVSGSVFDYRLYNGTLTSNEESYYLKDIQQNGGKTCLPWF